LGRAFDGSGFAAVRLLGDELSLAAASLLCGFLDTSFRWQRLRCYAASWGHAFDGSGFAAVQLLGDELSMAAASLLCGFLKRLFLSKDPRQFCWPWF
jgi:hypothetical protein